MMHPHRIPPTPEVMAALYADYLAVGRPAGLSFKQYLVVIGYTNPAEDHHGMDDGAHFSPGATGPDLIRIPSQPITGGLKVKVLLVDFADVPGALPVSHYEALLFSKNSYLTGSMRDYFREVSLGKVDVTGSVHGWFRMPQLYSYYTNGESGQNWHSYPRNAQGMAEDAVQVALNGGVSFDSNLDLLGNGTVTALFIVHAGLGAEGLPRSTRGGHIWSHKWGFRRRPSFGPNLTATVYLTVPHNAKIGVCSHELGHLAFQWEDFYDPNYDEDGSYWDGSGDWDLMAGGSHNAGGITPAHPAGLHKAQHGWVEIEEVRRGKQLALDPFTSVTGKVAKLISPNYRPGQYLILENRTKWGFDRELPGEGLLVWRVDESKEMFKPDRPALLLVQADGQHDLESGFDRNQGDAGDPFPGTAQRTELRDTGDTSTSFPNADPSGIMLKNITRDPASGKITLDVAFVGDPPADPPAPPGAIEKTVTPNRTIPDDKPAGIESKITLAGEGTVLDLAVKVDIEHTYIGDLRVELVTPAGEVATLHAETGGRTVNLKKTYRSSEHESLAALQGTPVKGDWKLRVKDLESADEGTLKSWGIAIVPTAVSSVVKKTNSQSVPIPDNRPDGVSSPVTVGTSGRARSIAVTVDIAHTYIGDIRVELIAPDGEAVMIRNRAGGSGDNLKTTFRSSESAALAALVGKPILGTWALRVSDVDRLVSGTLKSWTLEIETTAAPKTVTAEATPGLAIPDDSPQGAASGLRIEKAGTLQSMALKARVTHTYIGDLKVELVAPSGAKALLHDRDGGRAHDLSFDLHSSGSAVLGALVGQPIQGTWLFRVTDLDWDDTGTIDQWSLELTYA